MTVRRLLASVAVGAVVLGGQGARPADAAGPDILVTTPEDVVDPADGQLSLREAIDLANATAGDDVVDLGGRTAVLGVCDQDEGGPYDEDANVHGDLDVNDGSGDLTIMNGVVEQRCEIQRVLDVNVATALELRDVTVTGGEMFRPGGGIASAGPLLLIDATVTGNDGEAGGGVYGTVVVVRRSSITANHASGIGFGGGGILATQEVRITDSVVTDNTVGWWGNGGGLRAPDVVLRRSTVSHNETTGRGASGGGVWAGRTALVVDSTISDNRSTYSFRFPDDPPEPDMTGGLDARGSLDVSRSTIVRNESLGVANISVYGPFRAGASVIGERRGSGGSCRARGAVSSGGYNVVSVGGRCGLGAGTGDRVRQPRLDLRPLADNGGLGPTHLPIGRRLSIIPPGRCGAATDQRGEPRPQGASCEAGAVEVP